MDANKIKISRMTTLASRFKTALKANSDMPPSQLASALGLSKQTVYGWLDGAEPRISQIQAAAKELKVDACWLAFGHDPQPIEKVDFALLQQIIVGVEKELEKHRASLPPEKKAHLFVMAYDRFMSLDGRVNHAALSDFVILAK